MPCLHDTNGKTNNEMASYLINNFPLLMNEKSNIEKVAKFQKKLETLEAGIVNFRILAEDISNRIRDRISFNDARVEIKRVK